jgi:Fe2+ transport system protein B
MISSKDTVRVAIQKAAKKKVYIEGNFIKLLAETSDEEVKSYIEECKRRDQANRKKRLAITKQVQKQNSELENAAIINKSLILELQESLEKLERSKKEAEQLRDEAVEDLETIQKRTQYELIGTIVKVALWVIVGVGVLTTAMYGLALMSGTDTQIIGSTWSNMFGILLTNAFSIVGTIMGVKYATEKD